MTDYEKRIIRELRIKGKGYKAISAELGIPVSTVQSFCKRNNLNGSGSGDGTRCLNCGKQIVQKPGVRKIKFCSDKCRWHWWNTHLNEVHRKSYKTYQCKYCGKAFEVYGNRKRKYCCHECYIKDRFGGGSDE